MNQPLSVLPGSCLLSVTLYVHLLVLFTRDVVSFIQAARHPFLVHSAQLCSPILSFLSFLRSHRGAVLRSTLPHAEEDVRALPFCILSVFTMSTKESMAKKERLTLGQLASYDDILTDALIDHVSTNYALFWS